MKTINPIGFYFAFIVLFAFGQNTIAGSVKLDDDEITKLNSICPSCIERPVLIFGDADIGFGKHFRKHFFQGKVPRGYMLTPAFTTSDFSSVIRNDPDYDHMKSVLVNRFSEMALIVAEDGFGAVRILKDPEVYAIIPEALYQCLSVKDNKWGCGIALKNETECCEKGLGSPVVTVTWNDPTVNETVELKFSMGSSILTRKGTSGGKIIYYCLNTEPAEIKEK